MHIGSRFPFSPHNPLGDTHPATGSHFVHGSLVPSGALQLTGGYLNICTDRS